MALGDVYQLTLVGEHLGEDVRNIFHFLYSTAGSSGNPKSQVLAEEFEATSLPDILAVTHKSCVYSRILCQNLNDIADVFDNPVTTGTGLVTTGDSLPSFNTWSFQLRPINKSIRWGRKGFAGVPEAQTEGNDPTAGTLGLLGVLGAQLASNLIAPTLEQFNPRVARINPASVIPFIPLAVPIAEAIYRRLGTQLSRARGSGS